MSNLELFLDGLKLMVFGMGTVFAFLVLMVFCMKLMYLGIKPFIGVFDKPAPAAKPAASSGNDAALAAAAVAAVEIFRKK